MSCRVATCRLCRRTPAATAAVRRLQRRCCSRRTPRPPWSGCPLPEEHDHAPPAGANEMADALFLHNPTRRCILAEAAPAVHRILPCSTDSACGARAALRCLKHVTMLLSAAADPWPCAYRCGLRNVVSAVSSGSRHAARPVRVRPDLARASGRAPGWAAAVLPIAITRRARELTPLLVESPCAAEHILAKRRGSLVLFRDVLARCCTRPATAVVCCILRRLCLPIFRGVCKGSVAQRA